MASEREGAARNRLGEAISPYLLQHQHNPVDWYPWGEEALARAKAENKPIFVSVGYSTCYWCHVMERESFSDQATAELMNRHFINIKIDREERPDLDEIYMAATQLLTQQGGWPNSVFLTPDLRPFYAGTYFPPAPKHGLPSFRGLISGLAEAWEKRREEVLMQAEELEGAMRRFLEERGEPQPAVPGPEAAARSLDALRQRFDAQHGGFGNAPKFPTPANLFLLEEFAATDRDAAQMLDATFDAMARGGIYDQLAGGFHRYATDRAWLVPHFEKMLYDNAQLLELYARHHARTGEAEAARIVRETVIFLEREMRSPEGGFWSALDAETDGHEGAYHVWTKSQLEEALGAEDAAFLAPIYGFDEPPFFEGEYYVLHLPVALSIQADRRRMGRDDLLGQIAPLKARLLAAREERQKPRLDDKILTDWNGMTISGLAEAGRCLDEPRYLELAAEAAAFLLAELRPDGRLLHSWRQGEARIDAFLGDYVFLVRGLLALHRVSGERRWLEQATALTGEQIERLGDPQGGFFVAGKSDDLLFRSKEVFDGALPATNGVAVLNLLDLWHASGDERWLEEAERALRAFAVLIGQRPDGARTLALATRRHHTLAGDRTASAREDTPRIVTAEVEVEPPGEDGWRPFRLGAEIVPGWHVYAHQVAEPLVATRLTIEGGELRDVEYPAGTPLRTGESERVEVYEGRFEVRGALRGGEGARLELVFQPCDDKRCLLPGRIALALEQG